MSLVLLAGGFLLMMFPGWLNHRRAMGAAQFARVARASLVIGFISVAAGLATWSVPAALHWADAIGVPGLCDAAVHRLPLGGLELAITTLAVAALMTGRALSAITRARRGVQRARIDPYFGRHQSVGAVDLVVVPGPQVVAVAVPGDHPQVVLSEGLVKELTHAEVDAVVRHEIAHLRLRHRSYLLVAALVDHVFGWIPPVRSTVTDLRDALETWADLASIGAVQGRAVPLRSALRRLGARRGTTSERSSVRRRIENLDHAGADHYANGVGTHLRWIPAGALAFVASAAFFLTFQIIDTVVRCRAL